MASRIASTDGCHTGWVAKSNRSGSIRPVFFAWSIRRTQRQGFAGLTNPHLRSMNPCNRARARERRMRNVTGLTPAT
jgi:hypothetical protein